MQLVKKEYVDKNFCKTNDSRLSNNRNPNNHNHQYPTTASSFRFSEKVIGLYANGGDAVNNANRKGWIGFDSGMNLNVINEGGGVVQVGNNKGSLALRGTSQSGFTNFFYPNSDNSVTLGLSNNRWKEIYATSGSIVTSDETKKTNIKTPDDVYYKLAETIKFVQYRFIETGQEDGIGRIHFGAISQQVEQVMNELGLTAKDFAGFCKDNKTVDVTDKNGNVTQLLIENKFNYALRYDELQNLKIWYLEEKTKRLENKIEDLELLISNLSKI